MRTREVFLPLFVMLAASAGAAANDDDPLHPAAPFLRDSTFDQHPDKGKLKGRLLRVKRPLFIVKDLGLSLDFYVDVVGLEVYEVEFTFNRDPESLGYKMFNIPKGEPKRMATLNTSDKVRGMTLQEVPEMDIVVGQSPRTFGE